MFPQLLDEKSQQTIMDHKQEEDDEFVVIWMIFQRATKSISIHYYADLKDQIKRIEPAQFPGQNITMMVVKLRGLCLELANADQYEHLLTLCIVKNFLKGGGPNNDLWKMPLLMLIPKLDEALMDSRHMTLADQTVYMKGEKLYCTHVTEDGMTNYQQLKDNGEWGPAKRNSRHPRGFMALPAPLPPPEPEANALIQQSRRWIQRKEGWKLPSVWRARTLCKRLPQETHAIGNQGRDKTSMLHPTQEVGLTHKIKHKGEMVWTRTINGVQMFWCQKCRDGQGRWNTSHGTATSTKEIKEQQWW